MFGDGSRDARDSKELSMKTQFFTGQTFPLKTFTLKLNVSTIVFNGYENTTAYGTSTLNVIVNSPPENGTCAVTEKVVDAKSGEETWVRAQTGTALVMEFRISCQDWVDPDGHAITKYKFKSNDH